MTSGMTLAFLRHLDLSAASGLVQWNGFLYSVADDGLELLRTDLDGADAVRLPLNEASRIRHIPKQEKPDFEALMISGDELVAFGSGSTEKRCQAMVLHPESGRLRSVDLRPLYDALGTQLHELNIEGAVIRGDQVLLAQRGNGARKQNALVRLDRARFIQELAAGDLSEACLLEVVPVMLGDLEGVPLSLTDLTIGPRAEVLFTAAAEDTENPYEDGEVMGSIVGVIDHQSGSVQRRISVAGVKLEGVCWVEPGELRLVADPDDPTARAPLYGVVWK
jgi:hypothetical protein